jgi:hypothetical protein
MVGVMLSISVSAPLPPAPIGRRQVPHQRGRLFPNLGLLPLNLPFQGMLLIRA